jgi:hypothetical protein
VSAFGIISTNAIEYIKKNGRGNREKSDISM